VHRYQHLMAFIHRERTCPLGYLWPPVLFPPGSERLWARYGLQRNLCRSQAYGHAVWRLPEGLQAVILSLRACHSPTRATRWLCVLHVINAGK